MRKINFNNGWVMKKAQGSAMMAMFFGMGDLKEVTLPHDAMIHETPVPDAKSGGQTGFYPGGQYIYAKKFVVPEEWRTRSLILEFEGVYQTAMVYVNSTLVASNEYGYSGFDMEIGRYLDYGQENEIKVIADNTATPNSRWYTGTGIYRDVNLWIGDDIHVEKDGVHIRTKTADSVSAEVEISARIRNITRGKRKIRVTCSLWQGAECVAESVLPVTLFSESEDTIRAGLCVEKPALWSPDEPNLYDVRVRILDDDGTEWDSCKIPFGIRTVSIDARNGVRINGNPVKLRGACIHHDNGILGAATYADAEEFRMRRMREAGFNSIRCAHNPASKALLDACDRNGILVMDEVCDVWTYHKNTHDAAFSFLQNWQEIVDRMVIKDYNHASVILYSTGNEIIEVGYDGGARLGRQISNRFHELDPDRYTTAGINGMMASSSAGFRRRIEADVLADMPVAASGEQSESVNAMNTSLSLMQGERGDRFAQHPLMTQSLEESEMALDVIGLNYLTGRHELEHEIHPQKALLGSETYPADIVRLWSIVRQNSHVVGDYTWAGYDYLGEAGCGIFHYDGAANFSDVFPERLAYIGDINLIGYRRPISYYREIVFGLRKDPYIAVERLDRAGQQPSKTAWMFKDNISSWTWPGYQGEQASVDVYADADEVELFLNGQSLGKKACGEAHEYMATYDVAYVPGELVAVAYRNQCEVGCYALHTAEEGAFLQAEADRTEILADGQSLAFVTVTLTDKAGTPNLFAGKRIHVEVSGAGTLQAFGSADPAPLPTCSYDDVDWDTYDGQVMAAIRSANDPGEARVTFSADGCEDVTVVIRVTRGE